MADSGYDSYIVTFKDDTTEEEIERHIEQLEQDGGVVTQRYTIIKGYAARIPPAFLDTLQNSLQDGDGVVEAIELDGTVTAFPESTPTNGA